MKVQNVVSDLDGEEVKDYLHISIERPGFTIEYPKNVYTNRLEADLLEEQLQPFIAKLVYHRMELTPPLVPERK